MNFYNEEIINDLITENLMQNEIINNNYILKENENIDFRHISYKNLNFKNSLLKEIDKETKKLETYFFNKIQDFPKIFEGKNFTNIEETYKYLESISIPNKCTCAGIIDNIPGWKCVECSIYENSIYCSKCYINSKEMHKNHKVEFLNLSGGMCDCGDPDALYSFCPEHCGPYTEQKQIDEYISKIFPENILKNIKIFLDDLFYQFTKYLILTEKCKLFYDYILQQSKEKIETKNKINHLKDNFGVIFKNFMNFLRKITEKNIAMLHIVASYFLKNNLSENIEIKKDEQEQFYTTHSCIKISNDNIEILYKDQNANKNIFSSMNFSGLTKHKCECPFLRLFISNYRNNIKSLDVEQTEDEKLFLSFTQNLFLRKRMSIIFFFLYKEVILNNSDNLRYVRNQFFIEDSLILIAKKSNLIEEMFDFLYEYIKHILEKNKRHFDLGIIDKVELDKWLNDIRIYMIDSKYLSKPKVRQLMLHKTYINIKLIDILCLFHNQLVFKSITPHPQFQVRKEVIELLDTELSIFFIINMTQFITDWENFEKIGDIFHYFVDNILLLKQKNTLGKDEFTYHIPLYKYFGSFINSFCFNYALNRNTNFNEAIEYIKNNLFRSKEEMNQVIDIILEEYFKFYGFIIGIRNGFFNYYEVKNYNFIYFNDKRFLIKDIVLLKYLFAMSEEPIKLNFILEKSNVENTYSIFKSIFDQSEKDEQGKTEVKSKGGFFGFNFSFDFIKRPFSYIQSFFIQKPSLFEDKEENNFIMQWRRVLELIIPIIKNDTSPLCEILNTFEETISLKTKNIELEKVKSNKNLMNDCRYMLKQDLIQTFIANGNLMDLEQIKKAIYPFYFNIFDMKEFNEILNDITLHKINGEKKQFFIKDSELKFLDMNYYFSPMVKSKAEIYINDFKKDVFKMNNSYYYSPSELTFDFYNKVYEKVLLCQENLELFSNVLEILLNPINEDKMKNYDANSIRSIMLPVIFNFLSIFGTINSTSFYDFKLKNENLIQKICNTLNDVINANKENNFLDSELADNIVELIKQLNSYKTIKEYVDDGNMKLNNKSYNTNEEELRINFQKNAGKDNINLKRIESKKEEKKNKINNMKDKLKNKMKKKSESFMDQAKKNKVMKRIIDINEKNEEISKNNDNEEIMCFSCRNSINLKSFEKPYGKLGLIVEDYFYDNSIISTLTTELNQIQEKEDNLLIKECSSNIIKNMQARRQKNFRINSCGHYFHESCFKKGKTFNGFKCHLCEKVQNVLIPPLNNLYNKDNFLKPILKLKDIFDNNFSIESNNNIIENNHFDDIILNFLKDSVGSNIFVGGFQNIEFEKLIQYLVPKYQSYINYLANLIYSNEISFHKHQQITIMKNLFLSIRYLIHINDKDTYQIINHIHRLIKKIQNKVHTEFMPYNLDYYNQLFDELLICFCILLDYDELKNSFVYLINLILPYITFFMFLKSLVINNNLYSLEKKDTKEYMTLDNIKKFLNENNTQISNNFIKFLHKLFFVKLITTFDVNDDKIEHNLKNLSNEQLFSLINLEKLYQSLSKNDKNEINFSELFNKIPELLSSCDYYNKDLLVDYDKILTSMIKQINETKQDFSQLVKPDLIIQFIPYEFKLISLDNQIFDFLEKYIFERCMICNKESKYYFICLICGQKVCANISCDLSDVHVKNCCGKMGAFLYISDMKLYFINSEKKMKIFFPLYINESGVGPDRTCKGREFKLSKENYETALKNYISLDIKL